MMQLQVKNVDTATLAEAKTENKSVGATVQRLLKLIGVNSQEKLETYFLPSMIEKKLPSMMSSMMSEKMTAKGVKTEVKVLPERKQEKYFNAKLKELRSKAVVVEE